MKSQRRLFAFLASDNLDPLLSLDMFFAVSHCVCIHRAV